MAIYGRFGDVIQLRRLATIEEARRERDPRNRERANERSARDAEDQAAIDAGKLAVGVFADEPEGEERVFLADLCRADGGWTEIVEAFKAVAP